MASPRSIEASGGPLLLGVNYHPSASGIDYWRDFDSARIGKDFSAIAEAGITAVRVFLLWRDFEPQAGEYDPQVLDRLETLADLAERAGLSCLCSMLTVWMNGQLFEPPWFEGRSLWSDPELTRRAHEFVGTVAGRLRGRDNVVAYDIGDELPYSRHEETRLMSASEVRTWWAGLAEAIRSVDPEARVIQCMDGSAIAGENRFHPAAADVLDGVGVHVFPLWNPYGVESNSAPRASRLVGYVAAVAAVWGPVLIDEVGCYAAEDELVRDYLSVVLPAAWYRGAWGTFVWCWQDFTGTGPPYELRPNERAMGLLDANARPKPQLAAVREFAETLSLVAELRPTAAPAAIVVDEPSDEPKSYLTAGEGVTVGASFTAHVLASSAHLPHTFTRPCDASEYQMLILPCQERVTLSLRQRLESFIRSGGTVLLSPGTVLDAFPGRTLAGAELIDFRLADARRRGVVLGDSSLEIDLPPGKYQVLAPEEGDVLARFEDGSAAVLENRLGAGRFVYCTFALEAALTRPHTLDEQPWERLYEEVSDRAGIDRPWAHLPREVEALDLTGPAGEHRTLLLNHGQDDYHAETDAGSLTLPRRRSYVTQPVRR